MASMTAPFHRLLSFYASRSNSPATQTIRLADSLRGNLALGLDFPVALAVAVGRHAYLGNTGFCSLDIHVPSVPATRTRLEGLPIEAQRAYTRAEIVRAARPNGWGGSGGCVGLVGAGERCRDRGVDVPAGHVARDAGGEAEGSLAGVAVL